MVSIGNTPSILLDSARLPLLLALALLRRPAQ